ncbi:MAG TPA: PilZ domain-containing protein [Xanthobacteraceae bacterium]|nr:PilZ domain-containing protein [Xanthobacteraceae bacterium]
MVVVGNSRNHAEMRKKPRRSFHYGAKILKDKDTQVACAVADISHSGARINLQNDVELPAEFVLLLTRNGGAHRHCRLVWREGLTIGVKFPENR